MKNFEFKLNEIESERAKSFLQKHYHSEIGSIGGHINFIFVPTSIGDAVSVKCNICGKIKNITDYDSW